MYKSFSHLLQPGLHPSPHLTTECKPLKCRFHHVPCSSCSYFEFCFYGCLTRNLSGYQHVLISLLWRQGYLSVLLRFLFKDTE